MPVSMADETRADFSGSITSAQLKSLIANRRLETLQTSDPLEPKTCDLLNKEFFPRRPEVWFRILGTFNQPQDLSLLDRMPNVRRFAAETGTFDVSTVEHVAALVHLEALSIHIFELGNFDFLERLPPTLTSLSLGETRSKKPDLRRLPRFKGLQQLFLGNQQNDIDVVARLSKLTRVGLSGITTKGVDYLRGLNKLESLDIGSGGISDLSALTGMKQIKTLHLWRTKPLRDLSFIASLTGLDSLILSKLPNVKTLPDFSKLTKLRRLYLEGLTGLKNVAELSRAKALESLIVAFAKNLQPADFDDVLKLKSLKEIRVGFGSGKKNRTLEAAATAAGLKESEDDFTDFLAPA